jgi:PilZ domain
VSDAVLLTLEAAIASICPGARNVTPESGQPAPQSDERRFAARYQMDADVGIEWGSSTLMARLRDIGETGMFVVLSNPLWLNASFTAELRTKPPITFDCKVRRVEPGAGMGVEITPINASHDEFTKLIATLHASAKK